MAQMNVSLPEGLKAWAEARVAEGGVPAGQPMEQSFGARGIAPRAFYFCDPDGNVFEARHY